MMGADTTDRARAILTRGGGAPPRSPRERKQLGRVLPIVAEELRCTPGVDRVAAERGLAALWNSLEDDELTRSRFGTPTLGAGCFQAAAILGIHLVPRMHVPRWQGEPAYPVDFSMHEEGVRRPRLYAPIANDVPARVFYTPQPGEPLLGDDAFRRTAGLVRQFLGIDTPRWALDRDAPGDSKMAALFLRAVLERWPEAEQRLQWLTHPFAESHTAIGITGTLDVDGLAGHVGDLQEKIRQFFGCYPDGRLFVPASQWKEARVHLDAFRASARNKLELRSLEDARRLQLQPFRGVVDLLIRLAIIAPGSPGTALFEKLRRDSRRIMRWTGRPCDISETVALDLGRERPADYRPDTWERSPQEDRLLVDIHETWLQSGLPHPAFIEGGPGSGKSFLLHRLTARLLTEAALFGPALRVRASELVRKELHLDDALRDTHRSLEAGECRRLMELAQSPALSGSVWLVVDGLDEVPKQARLQVRALIDRWPGPSLIGARPLPSEASGSPHVRIQPLDASRQHALFVLEGTPGHAELLLGPSWTGDGDDRRKEMVADLCQTPLGVSLLAMLPEEKLGPALDVPAVLRSCIAELLRRAEDNGRLPPNVAGYMTRGPGLEALGAAAWPMIRRGESTLTPSDLARVTGAPELRSAVEAVLNKSDLVQRVGSEEYQFSHKSLAEFCAATYLVSRSDSEAEMLEAVGEPGTDAVGFHFGALVGGERLTPFLRALERNPHRPLSSLALATRMLVANGPDRVETGLAVEVLARRLRLCSHLREEYNRELPGQLHETHEMWLALERWAETLRPHAATLLAACAPEVAQFLRGELSRRDRWTWTSDEGARDDVREGAAYALADRLHKTLRLDLPLEALTQISGGEEQMLARPDGPWILDLEKIFEVPKDDGLHVRPNTAARVWAQRAPPARQLERLDVLSECNPGPVAPVLDTVLKHGTPEQRREALLRAALNHLEWGHMDEGDWVVDVRFATRFTKVPSPAWLDQWEVLWASGLIGDLSHRYERLEPLYATFLDDPCGPARWRALVAHVRVHGFDPALVRARLQDDCLAVRVEAIALLQEHKHPPEPLDLSRALASLEDAERWTALAAIDAGRTLPLDVLLGMLAPRQPPATKKPDDEQWSPREALWQERTREHGKKARSTLLNALHERLQGEAVARTFFELLEGPHADVAEEISTWGLREAEITREMLARGSPRQRRVAAKAQHDANFLRPYVDDPDPEVAKVAQRAVEHEDKLQQLSSRGASDGPERQRQPSVERKPITLAMVAQHGTFEALWGALGQHRLPSEFEARDTAIIGSEPPDDGGAAESARKLTPEFIRDATIARLRQFYQPQHQPRLLAGLEDDFLAPWAVPLLRDHLPVAEVLALIPRGGKAMARSIEILQGTPHAREGARVLREALVSGKLAPPARNPEGAERWTSVDESTFHHDWCRGLAALDGSAAFLPLLDEAVPASLRRRALDYLGSFWMEWRQSLSRRPELVAWARGAERSADVEVREIALWLLAVVGDASDAERWRPLLGDARLPVRLLAAAVRLMGSFGAQTDLTTFRDLLAHSPEVGAEAAEALRRVGGHAVLDELVRLIEAPPPALREPSWRLPDWREAVAEDVIRFGDGEQAKRVARALDRFGALGEFAARHARLPEHVLFLADLLGTARSQDADYESGGGDGEVEKALAVLEGVANKVGRGEVHGVMIEAVLWEKRSRFGQRFREAFEEVVEQKLQPQDADAILQWLRDDPEHPIALRWLSATGCGEEKLVRLWRERAVPWWNETGTR